MGRGNAGESGALEETSIWHVFWKAAVGRDFFIRESLPESIRDRLTAAHRMKDRVLIDYLITPSEIHVISELRREDSPGDIARSIGSAVARRVRKAHPLRNPVFASKFSAHRLRSTGELRDVIRALCWRPVCLGLRRSLVYHAFSGLRTALGLTPIKDFNPVPLLRRFGDNVPSSRAALRAWIGPRPDDREKTLWELTLGLASVSAGGQAASAQGRRGDVAAALLAEAWPGGEPEALQLLEAWVAARIDLPYPGELHRSSRSAAVRGRALVACLAVDHRLCSAATVARHFGRAKATLCEQMIAARQSPEDVRILSTDPAVILAGAMGIRNLRRHGNVLVSKRRETRNG